jgi:hypothetical protein
MVTAPLHDVLSPTRVGMFDGIPTGLGWRASGHADPGLRPGRDDHSSPLTKKRMETVDEEVTAPALDLGYSREVPRVRS